MSETAYTKLKYMQVEVKHSFYQSFGGINFMNADFQRLGLNKIITQHLGLRNLTAVYSYADVLKTLFYMFSIGGDVLDDLNILREQLQDQPALKACSPDTVEYVCQELRQPTREVITDKGVKHLINEHDDFNRLLPALSLMGDTLNTSQASTLDYDGHIVENTKADNACNYKQTEGYYPVVLSINKLPVYIQNRNGNTPESYDQLNLIRKTVTRCEELGLQLKKFRADACCYEKETIEFLEQNSFTYYIRAEMSGGLRIALEDEPEWQPVILNNKKVEVCSIEEKLFGSQTYRRIVAYRYKVKGQLTIDDTNGYRYYGVVTNDTADALSCIEFYNQRGCEGEHHFKELDHDFGWNKLPFDNMEMNTVYLYATAIAYLLFNIFKKQYAAKTKMVQVQMRLKNFILHFVTLTAKWIKTGRRYILKIFTTKDYSPLFVT
jgi:hypothetical protein